MLQRILSAVEPPKRKRGFEIACAIVLSLATTASAWCAYQSKLWGGVQMARANAAVRAGREGAVNALAALQRRSAAPDVPARAAWQWRIQVDFPVRRTDTASRDTR